MINFIKGMWAFLVLFLILGKTNAMLVVSIALPIMYIAWFVFRKSQQKLLAEDRYLRTKKIDAEVISVVARGCYSSPDVVLKIRTDWAEELVVIGPKSNLRIQALTERDRIHIVYVKPADGSVVIMGENLIDLFSLEDQPKPGRPNPGYKAFQKAFELP